MVEITDTPIEASRSPRMTSRQWILVTAFTLGLATLAWGEASIWVGNVQGLEVRALYIDAPSSDDTQRLIYRKGSPILYQIQMNNRANLSFHRIEVQSSVHSDGISCEDLHLAPGVRLPGASISAPHILNLTSDQSYDFEVAYDIPEQVCKSSGHIQIRLQYTYQDRLQATTLTVPIHFQIE